MSTDIAVVSDVSPRGETPNQLIELTDDQQKKMQAGWSKLQACEAVLFADYVKYGAVLREIRSVDNGHYLAGLAQRGVASSSAQRFIDLADICEGFDDDAMARAADVGPSRLRELKIALKVNGTRALISSGSLRDGRGAEIVSFEYVRHLTVAGLVEWRKQTGAQLAAIADEHATKTTGPCNENLTAPTSEPACLTVARDELLSGVIRARVELERTRAMVTDLLRSCDDDFEQARVEAMFAARKIISAVTEEAHRLDTLLDGRFSASPAFASEGAERVRVNALIEAREKATALDADASLTARAKALAATRQGWRGAPPKSVAAAIAKARKLDKIALGGDATDTSESEDDAEAEDAA